MPNIRVRQALDRIDVEVKRVRQHVEYHSGIDPKDAAIILNDCMDIAKNVQFIEKIAQHARDTGEPAFRRHVSGDRRSSRGTKRRTSR